MINCRQFTEQVDAYIDGEDVEHGSRSGMWVHQLMCGKCRRYMNQLKDVARLGEKLNEQDRQDEELCCSDTFKEDLIKSYKKTNPGDF